MVKVSIWVLYAGASVFTMFGFFLAAALGQGRTK